jgi:hypothetical protein
VGYRGKLEEQSRARELRGRAWTLQEIADELGVSKSSVSLWVREVQFTPRRPEHGNRNYGARPPGPNKLRERKLEEIRQLEEAGKRRIGMLTDKEFLVVGAALYAGEGAKTDGQVQFANTNPDMVRFFCTWLRHFFSVEEKRLRCRLYLHQGLDLQAAVRFWSDLTSIPPSQFRKPYRAVPDAGIRNSKHELGCPSVLYGCSRTHRAIMGLARAVVDPDCLSGSTSTPSTE